MRTLTNWKNKGLLNTLDRETTTKEDCALENQREKIPEIDFYNKSQIFTNNLDPSGEFPKVIPNQLGMPQGLTHSVSQRVLPTKVKPVTIENKKPEITGREGDLLNQNVHSYLDFCHDIVPQQTRMKPNEKQSFENFGGETDHSSLNNNCPIHRHNEIVYLDKTAKVGACEECLLKLVRSGHELMPIGKTVREVQS